MRELFIRQKAETFYGYYLTDSPITEQEIVKPYFDRLKAKINELSNANPSYWHQCDVVDREDVIDLIDEILSE